MFGLLTSETHTGLEVNKTWLHLFTVVLSESVSMCAKFLSTILSREDRPSPYRETLNPGCPASSPKELPSREIFFSFPAFFFCSWNFCSWLAGVFFVHRYSKVSFESKFDE